MTYLRSRDARIEESAEPTVYDRVYDAARPELFFKSVAWRVQGPATRSACGPIRHGTCPSRSWPWSSRPTGGSPATRSATTCRRGRSRARTRSTCPRPRSTTARARSVRRSCRSTRSSRRSRSGWRSTAAGRSCSTTSTSSDRLRRSFDELAGYLFRALSFPAGAILLTGTGIVPAPPFSLEPGDRVTIEIARLGRLENPVVSVGRAG